MAAKLATDLLLLRSLGKLFPYRKFTSSVSAGIRTLSLMFFNENLLFCNLIEAFFSSVKLNFMHDGIVFCLSHLFKFCQLTVASMVLTVTSIGNQILYIIGNKFLQLQ